MSAVLIVDDDDEIREAIVSVLADDGYAVCEARDGEEALEILSDMPTRPCLVLLDMMMPRMNGNAFLDAIAHAPRLAALPVVIVSAYPGEVHAAARTVLRKPVDLDVLLDVVAKFCSRSPYAA
jgi:two-component system chemotaxis response regulator CheY